MRAQGAKRKEKKKPRKARAKTPTPQDLRSRTRIKPPSSHIDEEARPKSDRAPAQLGLEWHQFEPEGGPENWPGGWWRTEVLKPPSPSAGRRQFESPNNHRRLIQLSLEARALGQPAASRGTTRSAPASDAGEREASQKLNTAVSRRYNQSRDEE